MPRAAAAVDALPPPGTLARPTHRHRWPSLTVLPPVAPAPAPRLAPCTSSPHTTDLQPHDAGCVPDEQATAQPSAHSSTTRDPPAARRAASGHPSPRVRVPALSSALPHDLRATTCRRRWSPATNTHVPNTKPVVVGVAGAAGVVAPGRERWGTRTAPDGGAAPPPPPPLLSSAVEGSTHTLHAATSDSAAGCWCAWRMATDPTRGAMASRCRATPQRGKQ